MAQRIMQYQAVIQLAQQAPQIYDLPQLHRQMIEVLGIKNADKLVPTVDDQNPKDPISENMGFLRGEPTKAFIYQDQDAHIAAHTSFMKDPMIAAQMGQNPMAQQMMAAIQAHIAEHLAFSYRRKIEEQMGVPLPPPGEQLPEQVEVQLSQLVAQASAQLLNANMAQAQQAQAQQMQQDPLVQMQQAELQIKAQDAKTKELKVRGDLQLKAEELSLKARESAAKTGEDPQMAAMRMQQEIMQAQELHALEVANQQQQQQIQAQQAQQQMAQQQQVHGQSVGQSDQQHKMDMLQKMMQAKQQAQQPPTTPGKG
jgi:hypothetical protein